MAGLDRNADGTVTLQLGVDEVEVVASLAEGLVLRIVGAEDQGVGADAVIDRLAPTVSRGDVALERELRAMLREDLLSSRAVRLRELSALLREATSGGRAAAIDLDGDGAMRVVEAFNDLRIALASSIGFDEALRDALAPDDRRRDAVHLMDALAWLQGGLIEFIEGE